MSGARRAPTGCRRPLSGSKPATNKIHPKPAG